MSALLMAVAVGCATDGGTTARAGRWEAPVSWRNSTAHWVSQPRAVGGRFVAYLERDGLLSVAGVDRGTGELVWEVPASVSGLTSGVQLQLAFDDRLVYFGTPFDLGLLGDPVFVIAVDAASGTEVWRTTSTLILSDSLYDCGDDPDAFCVSDQSLTSKRALRIAKADGNMTMRTSPASAEPAASGRILGPGLYDLGGRDPEIIAALDPSGRTLWTRTASELFEGRPVSSDYGWIWDEYDEVLVGSLGWIEPRDGSYDLSRRSIAGVDAATGAVRWVDDGAELGCGGVTHDLLARREPIRCRIAGTSTNDVDDPDDVSVLSGLTVVMERFDPATGATVWAVDLGAAASLVSDTAPLVRLSSTTLAVGRDDGSSSVVVDVVSGATRPATDQDVGWCVTENIYRDRRTIPDPFRRRGHDYLTQCRPDGSAVPGLRSSPLDAGARLGQTFAWVDERGMHGATTAWVSWS